jgi:hypothetical protein
MPMENLTWFAATVVSWQSKPNVDMAQTPIEYCNKLGRVLMVFPVEFD